MCLQPTHPPTDTREPRHLFKQKHMGHRHVFSQAGGGAKPCWPECPEASLAQIPLWSTTWKLLAFRYGAALGQTFEPPQTSPFA